MKEQVKILAGLSEQQWSVVLEFLESSGRPKTGTEKLEPSGLPRETFSQTLAFLMGLSTTFDSPDEATQVALEAAEPALRLLVAERLAKALSSPFLEVVAKGTHLGKFHQRFFFESEIVTDLRPVFGGDENLEPAIWLVSHVLKLTVLEDGTLKEIFVGLEPRDLDNLAAKIDRAYKKQDKLRRIFKMEGGKADG